LIKDAYAKKLGVLHEKEAGIEEPRDSNSDMTESDDKYSDHHWRDHAQDMLPDEKFYAWYVDNDHGLDLPDTIAREEIELSPQNSFEKYYDAAIRTPAFEWLVSILKREKSLDPSMLDKMRSFSAQIMENLPVSLISRKRVQIYKATYIAEWDIWSFLREQSYDEPPELAIEGAIVLTGSVGSAQALTCGEYLRQTWPTNGDHIMRLLKKVVESSHAQSCLYSPYLCIYLDRANRS
jgi:hypothetical protein